MKFQIPKRVDTRPINFPSEEKQQLELEAQLYGLERESYQKLVESMEE